MSIQDPNPIFSGVWQDLHPDEPLWPSDLDATANSLPRRQSIMDHGRHEVSASAGSRSEAIPSYLMELDPRHWRRCTTPAMDTLLRQWDDGSVDTLIVLSPDLAYVRRDNGRGRKVKDARGTAVEMARLIQRLPAPGAPGAPSDEIPDPVEPIT